MNSWVNVHRQSRLSFDGAGMGAGAELAGTSAAAAGLAAAAGNRWATRL